MSVVEIKYFSDVLCVWAYASQARIDAVKETFGDDVQITQRFCSVFGDTSEAIREYRVPFDRGEYSATLAGTPNRRSQLVLTVARCYCHSLTTEDVGTAGLRWCYCTGDLMRCLATHQCNRKNTLLSHPMGHGQYQPAGATEPLSAFTGMLSAIDRNRCPPSNGMPVRLHLNTQAAFWRCFWD